MATRAAARTADISGRPNPDDDEPHPCGPLAPYVRALRAAHERAVPVYAWPGLFGERYRFFPIDFRPRPLEEPGWSARAAVLELGQELNPQPLPPGPPPEMLLGAQLALAIVTDFMAAVAQAQWLGDQASRALSHRLAALIDDWCGTRPRPWPKPKSGPQPDPWSQLDTTPALFAASSVFGRASETAENGAAEILAEAARKLANAGHAAVR